MLTEKGSNYILNDSDYEELLLNVKSEAIFAELIKIAMKKAYDTNINIETNNPIKFHTEKMGDDFLKAKRQDLQYLVTDYLFLYLSSIFLNYFAKNKCLTDPSTDGIISILKILQILSKQEYRLNLQKKGKDGNPWFFEPGKITMILLVLFEETDAVIEVRKEKGKKLGSKKKKKDMILYVLNPSLDNSIAFSHNLPRIIPPLKAESTKCIHEWVTPVKRGHHNIQVSDEAIKVLNIAQKKEFVVNEKFLRLLIEVNGRRESATEFTTTHAFEKKSGEYFDWINSVWGNALDITLFRTIYRACAFRISDRKDLHRKVLKICGISRLENYANNWINEVRAELSSMRSTRQLLLTSIDIGKIFKGYPLYYGTSLDFRLRMYPLQYLLSRTSGYLKNMLQESVARPVSAVGMRNMLTAYYSPDPSLLEKFNDTGVKKTFKGMKEFFDKNKLDLSENPLYFEMLQGEIEDIYKSSDKKSAIQLEIDQVGSGPTLIALVTQNAVLAEKCNLLGGPFTCIYSYILEKAVPHLEKLLEKGNIKTLNRDSKAYELLTTNRKAQKYALMCFFYNEKHLSRTDRWKENYLETYGSTVSDEEYELLKVFSNSYGKFMDDCFPKITQQLDILNQASQVVISQDLPVRIKTLDDCIIKWDFDHVKEYKRNYYNPVSGKHDQYKVHVRVSEKSKETQRSRKSKHKTSFRPNFIHSLDACLMRKFLMECYKKTGKKINHLHDCVMLHPNDVDIFYEIVSDVYCSPYMKTLANDLIFEVMKQDVRGPELAEIQKLQEQFNSNMDDFSLKKEVFVPRNCYRYEGTK